MWGPLGLAMETPAHPGALPAPGPGAVPSPQLLQAASRGAQGERAVRLPGLPPLAAAAAEPPAGGTGVWCSLPGEGALSDSASIQFQPLPLPSLPTRL